MILTDFSNIKIGNTDISSVYMGGEKLWPKGADTGTTGDRRIMRFTTTDGNTWDKDYISANTADNRLIEPIEKNATGWTYGEDVEYLGTTLKINIPNGNLLTFKGFGAKIKIKDASYLFYSEQNAKEIDTKNLDTSQATVMNWMFSDCSGLASLDVSHFDTSKVTNMYGMFWGCSGLTSLDLSNWNTSKVTDMSSMFNNCTSLKTITMKNCSSATVDKIKAALAADNITGVQIIQ